MSINIMETIYGAPGPTPNGGYAVQMPPGTPLPGAGVHAQQIQQPAALVKLQERTEAWIRLDAVPPDMLLQSAIERWIKNTEAAERQIDDLNAEIVTLKAEIARLTSPPALSSTADTMGWQIADCMASFGNGKLVP